MIELPTIPRCKKKTHSFSALNTFATICARRYALEKNRPWTDTPTTLRGSQIHAALEWCAVHYDAKNDPEVTLVRAADEFHASCPESQESFQKCGIAWPLERDMLLQWLLHTREVWSRITPVETEFWIKKSIPGARWPLYGKVDLKCKLDGLLTITDWKSTSNMNKVMTQFECDRSIQGRIYSWATGIRRVAFVYFSQFHDAIVRTSTYSEEDIEELELWLSHTARAAEGCWESGLWTLAEPTCWLCSETWCSEFSTCVGSVRKSSGVL